MTIRHRITLLVVLMFVALSAIGGYAVYQTRGSAAEVRKVTEGVVPSALASADLVSQVVTKYGLPQTQAQSEVDALLKGRQVGAGA